MAKAATKPNRFSGLLDTKLKKNRFSGLLGEQPQPEQPDFGMIAVPRKELPGVWKYDKQLDDLLGDPEVNIEDFLPLDVKYDFGRIVGMTEKPDETKDRMTNSLFYMVDFGIPPRLSYRLQDALSKQRYGKLLSPKETRNRLANEHFEKRRQYYRENFEPFSLFGNAFLQSLAGKPAMAIRGAKVYTPGEALGADWFLTKTSEYLESLRSKEKMTDVEAAATGKLWPIDRGASWYQIDPKLLPETINAWSATVGDQIPIMLMTLAGREIGKVAGKPAGTGIGGLYALITGGPEPTDVVTAPVIAKVTEKIVEHLSGAAPLVAMEAGGFMDRANAIGLDNDIAEKYARPYGLGSGAIEYSQWLWNLKAFKMLSPKVKMSILKKVLVEIGGATWEGLEELSQHGLENFLIGKAIEEQKIRTPEYDVDKPETWAGGKRAFGIGLGVSLITRLPGHSYTTIRSRKLAKQIQEQTDATKEESDFAVEAMAEGGRLKQGVVEVIAEQITKQEAKQAEAEVSAQKRTQAIDFVRNVLSQEQYAALDEKTKIEIGQKMLAEQGVEVTAEELAETPATEGVQAPQIAPEQKKVAEVAKAPPAAEIERPAEKVQASFDKYKKAMPNATEQEVVEALLEDGIRPPADMLKKYEDLPSVQRVLEQDEISRTIKRAAVAKPEAVEVAPEAWQLTPTNQQAADLGFTKEDQAIFALIENEGGQVNLSGVPVEGWFTYNTPDGLAFQSDIEVIDRGGYSALLKKAKEILGLEEEFAQPPTVAKATDKQLLERWSELEAIEKARRKPQEIKERQEIEDELIKRHPPETIEKDITDKARKKVIKDTEEEIQSHDLYQSALQHIREQQQALPPIQYEIARTKEKIPGEIKDYIGEPGTKGYKGYLWKYLTTYEENPNATGWDEALERVGGRPGDIGEFIKRLDQTIQLTRGKAAINQQALDIAIGQGDLHAEIISAKYEMLKEGFSATEINDALREIALKEDIDLEMVEGYYVPVEEIKYVRTKQEILRGLLKESQKAERKVQRPTLEEAAIRKATEIAHKTKEEQYVYERTGKDEGRFAVSKKPPTKGAYKKITPPTKGELKGKVEEGYAGFTSEELQRVKKLRQKVHAIAINKGLTKKALSELKKKHVGYRKLTGKVASRKISLEQLENLLKAVQKARPKRVGYKRVITPKTEKKIQSLKENLIEREHLSEERFAKILEKEVQGKEPKYVDAKNFITETQGKEIIQRMNDEAEIAKSILPYQKAVEADKSATDVVLKIREAASRHKRMPKITESTRYYFAQAQNVTGEPFYYLFKDLENTHLELNEARRDFFDSLTKEVPNIQTEIMSDETALERIDAYILSKSNLKNKPAYPAKITKNEIKIAKSFEGKYKEYQLDARLARFKNWYEAGRPETGRDAIPQYAQYRREINKAVDIYESGGEDALIKHLKTQEWGVILSGYEPLINILRPKVRTYKPSAITIGTGRIRARTSIDYHPQETNIFQRTSSYMRNMDMLAKMRPKIRAFIRLAEDNADKFSKPDVFIRSVEDYIQALKGFNIHENYISKILSAFYAQAGRARLAISLRICLLNTVEAPAFNVDKSILIDPRNKPLTREQNEWFQTYVNQLEPLLKEFMMVTTKPVLEYIPVVRRPIKFLNDIAKDYAPMAHFDKFSRQWSFWGRINQIDRATEEGNAADIYKASKINDYTEAEQEMAMSILAKDGKEAFARYVARTHVEKTHYLYSREQRSPFELNHARVWSNLMTFSRSWVERIAKATGGLLDRNNSFETRARNLKILISVLAGAWLLGEIYKMVMHTKRNPYDPRYIIDYELGGLAWGAFETVSNLFQGILRASADKKAVSRLPTLIAAVPNVLVPFYMYIIRATESLTGKKYIDREFLRALREAIDEDYKRRPEAYKIDRTTLEKFTRMVEGRGVDIRIEEKDEAKDFGGAKE